MSIVTYSQCRECFVVAINQKMRNKSSLMFVAGREALTQSRVVVVMIMMMTTTVRRLGGVIVVVFPIKAVK